MSRLRLLRYAYPEHGILDARLHVQILDMPTLHSHGAVDCNSQFSTGEAASDVVSGSTAKT